MTLSNKAVRSYLSRSFSCTWTNLEGEASAGSSFAHAPKDAPGRCIRGNGEHNVQMLMLTPKGELLNVVAGYVDAEDLLVEAKLATSLWRKVKKAKEEGRAQIVRDAHQTFLKGRTADAGSTDPFARFIESRIRTDHRFVARHPLMDARRFRTEDLVGNAKTFFGSSTGKKPRGRVGEGGQEKKDPPRSKTGGKTDG